MINAIYFCVANYKQTLVNLINKIYATSLLWTLKIYIIQWHSCDNSAIQANQNRWTKQYWYYKTGIGQF